MVELTAQSDPFSSVDVVDLFGADAADLEDAGRLYSFFVENQSYEDIRQEHPICLAVGQRGIGKTALMRVASFDDKREGTPQLFLKGYQVLAAAASGMEGAAALTAFKSSIESAIVTHVAGIIAEESSEAFGAPPVAGSIFAKLAGVGSAILLSKSEALRTATQKLTPWLFSKISTLNIYIDDTDIEWDGSPKAADKIGRLIQACFSIAADNNGDVRFKISLRSDLFNYLKVTSDVIYKVQSGIVQCRWDNDQIFRVLAKRVAVHDGKESTWNEELTQESMFRLYLDSYFEVKFMGEGVWKNAPMRQILLSFIRQRPRDLVGLCHLEAKAAKKRHSKIDTASLESVIRTYSDQRLNDTIVEFRTELPAIEKLLYEMRPEQLSSKAKASGAVKKKRSYYRHDELMAKINKIRSNLTLMFSYQTVPATSGELVEFLYRINFIVASKTGSDGKLERMYYDFADDRLRETRLGKWDWEVHPAYRWAIQSDEADIWADLSAATSD